MTKNNQEYYDYLLDLRNAGVFNMMESPKLLSLEFKLSKKQARDIFVSWTETITKEKNNA